MGKKYCTKKNLTFRKKISTAGMWRIGSTKEPYRQWLLVNTRRQGGYHKNELSIASSQVFGSQLKRIVHDERQHDE